MSQVNGYILPLSKTRKEHFESYSRSQFSEPVPEFKHSQQMPLVCFVVLSERITHISLASRGQRAGTGLSRLNLRNLYPLDIPVVIDDIINAIAKRYHQYLREPLAAGGLLPPKSFSAFLEAFMKLAPETRRILERFGEGRRERINSLSPKEKEALGEQKDALFTALNIADLDREVAQYWDVPKGQKPRTYLDGLSQLHSREDDAIIRDMVFLPGMNEDANVHYTGRVFKRGNTRLHVVMANRRPLEELLGTDLIYFHERYGCHIMVQYKMMEKQGNQYGYRLSDVNLSKEMARMESLERALASYYDTYDPRDYRLNDSPFFFKLCYRMDFDPDSKEMSKGMYLPFEYFKRLMDDRSTMGEKGGKVITQQNVDRYFDNTSFKTLMMQGWVGSHVVQSMVLEAMIEKTLAEGRSAVVAIRKQL